MSFVKLGAWRNKKENIRFFFFFKPIVCRVFTPFMLGGNVSKEIVSSRNARYVSENFTNLEIPTSKTLW